MSFSLHLPSLFNALTSGAEALSATGAASAISTALGASTTTEASTVKGYLATLQANYTDADIVKQMTNNIKMTSGLPATVSTDVGMLESAAAAATANPAVGLPELYTLVEQINSLTGATS